MISSSMIEFLYWSRVGKTDKLTALREAVERTNRELQALRDRHDRLMFHLGLFEIDGPRIEKIPGIEQL